MNQMSSDDEARLIRSVEKAIGLTNKGLSPNDAICKVATEEQFRPAHIRRMAQAFNKSKSVHHMKTAAEGDRSGSFDLADPQKILQLMFLPENQQKTASEVQLPTGDFSRADVKVDMLAKVASFRPDERTSKEVPASSTFNILRKRAQVCEKVRRRMYDEVKLHKHAFERSLDELAEQLVVLQTTQLRKVAQLVVNAYPTTGTKLMRIVSGRMNRPVPEMQKMANAAVLPLQEPYLTISKVYEHAEKMARAEAKYDAFQKEALMGGLGDAITGSVVAEMGISPAQLMAAKKKR